MVKLNNTPALIVVDMQNAFCHKDGTFAKLGLHVDELAVPIIPQINKLRSACHAAKVPIFFTRVGFSPDYSDKGIGNIGEADRIQELKGFIRGTWDFEVIDELKPDENEIVIDKTRNSAFMGTSLAGMLAERGVNHLIVTGVGTDVCVESTARDAYQLDIHVTTVDDATATTCEEDHWASIRNLRWFGGSAPTAEVIEALSKL